MTQFRDWRNVATLTGEEGKSQGRRVGRERGGEGIRGERDGDKGGQAVGSSVSGCVWDRVWKWTWEQLYVLTGDYGSGGGERGGRCGTADWTDGKGTRVG